MHYSIDNYVITVIAFIPFRESESDKKIKEIMINVVKRTKEVLGETGMFVLDCLPIYIKIFIAIYNEQTIFDGFSNSNNFRGRAI